MKRIYIPVLLASFALSASAQRITYNHDNAKMNQITVQETGAGSLTPDLYYQTLHNRYRRTASAENKMSFRTMAGISASQQIREAEKIDSSMVKRAEIEALNMADRQVDLAWISEGRKIESRLEDFQRNINRLVTAGGQNAHVSLWREYYNKFTTAVTAIKQAYMPNSQRKKEYLRIYTDIAEANENLLRFLVQLHGRGETSRLLTASYTRPDRRGEIARVAMNRWRGAGWSTNTGGNGVNAGDGNEQRVIEPFQPIKPDGPIKWDGDRLIIGDRKTHKD
ncbi:MAG: DUF5045 domain-containing protein [Paramuribaculum sp.]